MVVFVVSFVSRACLVLFTVVAQVPQMMPYAGSLRTVAMPRAAKATAGALDPQLWNTPGTLWNTLEHTGTHSV